MHIMPDIRMFSGQVFSLSHPLTLFLSLISTLLAKFFRDFLVYLLLLYDDKFFFCGRMESILNIQLEKFDFLNDEHFGLDFLKHTSLFYTPASSSHIGNFIDSEGATIDPIFS